MTNGKHNDKRMRMAQEIMTSVNFGDLVHFYAVQKWKMKCVLSIIKNITFLYLNFYMTKNIIVFHRKDLQNLSSVSDIFTTNKKSKAPGGVVKEYFMTEKDKVVAVCCWCHRVCEVCPKLFPQH